EEVVKRTRNETTREDGRKWDDECMGSILRSLASLALIIPDREVSGSRRNGREIGRAACCFGGRLARQPATDCEGSPHSAVGFAKGPGLTRPAYRLDGGGGIPFPG